MDILLLIAVFGLGYAIFKQHKSNETTYTQLSQKESPTAASPRGYNPYILNQFQEMKDRIFSADMRENRIETKPSVNATGVYGITETQLKLHPSDSITVVYGPKHTLNV